MENKKLELLQALTTEPAIDAVTAALLRSQEIMANAMIKQNQDTMAAVDRVHARADALVWQLLEQRLLTLPSINPDVAAFAAKIADARARAAAASSSSPPQPSASGLPEDITDLRTEMHPDELQERINSTTLRGQGGAGFQPPPPVR